MEDITMLKKFICAITICAGISGSLMADSMPIVWKFPAATAEWSEHFNAKMEEGDDFINLIPTKRDHGIINPEIDLDPTVYNCLRVTYLAKGFKTHITTGDLFFLAAGKKKFSAADRIKLPSLIPDGQVRVFTMRLDTPEWKNAGKIKALRLDITDQMPGDVQIFKIELLSRQVVMENATWDFANGAGSWDTPDGMTVSEENGELKMEVSRIDSHLFNSFDQFDGSKYSKLKITYRAEGFTRTTGGIFFMKKGDKNYTPKQFFRFPGLICDGKEHSFTIDVKLPADIDGLRLDIVDQCPGTVYLKKIEFLP